MLFNYWTESKRLEVAIKVNGIYTPTKTLAQW